MNSSEQPESGQCQLDCNLRILRDLPVFAGLPADLLRVLAYLSETEVYGTGQVMLLQHDPAEGAVVVVRGQVQVQLAEQTVGVLDAGACIGGLALLGAYRWPYGLTAASEVECLRLDRRKLLPQLEAKSGALSRVAGQLVARVIGWDRQRLDRGAEADLPGPGIL